MTTIFSIFGLFSANFTTPVSALSLTLSVPSDALSLNIQPTSTFTKSSPSSVSVKTDAFAGYSLSIKAQSSNELVNGTSKLTSISENQSEEQYQGEGNLNTWGYKPSKFNSLENTLFLPGPTTSPSVIETTKAANNDAATSYEFTLAAKADATIAHGEYKNTFVFSATANTVSYNIKYELNSGSWEGTSPQTGSTAESTVALDSHAPTRNDYEFKGWCPKETHDENCSTTSYQPGNSYPLINGDNNITLWAMWKSVKPTTMQGFGNYCDQMQVNDTLTLRDTRDDNEYTIAKLKDNRCWMTQNLRIQNTTINSSNSDMQNGTYAIPSSGQYSSISDYAPFVYVNNNEKYGAYYSWSTATAGYTSSNTAPNSICPKNWHLPSHNEYQNMIAYYTYTSLQQPPSSFPLPGEYTNSTSSFSSSESVGWYWNRDGVSCMRMDPPNSLQSCNTPKCCGGANYGWNIRCINAS